MSVITIFILLRAMFEWLFDILEEALSSFSSLGKNEGDSGEQNVDRNKLNQTADELKALYIPVEDLVLNLGKDLINEIQAEENFPPDYLKNVIEKVTSVKVRYDTAEGKINKIKVEMDYSDYHRNFEKQLQILTMILQDCEIWLQDFPNRIQCDPASEQSSMDIDKGKFINNKSYDLIL